MLISPSAQGKSVPVDFDRAMRDHALVTGALLAYMMDIELRRAWERIGQDIMQAKAEREIAAQKKAEQADKPAPSRQLSPESRAAKSESMRKAWARRRAAGV